MEHFECLEELCRAIDKVKKEYCYPTGSDEITCSKCKFNHGYCVINETKVLLHNMGYHVEEGYPEFPKARKPIPSSVNHPSHYNQGEVECIDAIDSAVAGLDGEEAFYTGIAMKYLFRWKWKNGIEDIDKAIWYLTRLKEHLEKSSGSEYDEHKKESEERS